MDKIDQLIDRINQNLSYYHEHIMDFEKDQIIDMAGRISVMSDAHYYLTEHHTFDYEQAEYLLKFKNPLEIVADKWETRMSDISDMGFDLDSIFDKQNAEQDGYELADADTTEMQAPPGEGDKTPPPFLHDRQMAAAKFSEVMNKLLPHFNMVAFANWISYADRLEENGNKNAAQVFSELTEGFILAHQQYGEKIATQTFNIAENCCFPPSEINGAANHLHHGVDVDKVTTLAIYAKLNDPPVGNLDIKAEAERIISEFAGLTEPNSPAKTHFMVKLSDTFIYHAGSNDMDKLYDALPYETTSMSTLKGETGIFVFVAKEELQKETPTAEQLKGAARDEAARLLKELKALKQPNNSFSNEYSAKISDAFMKQASFSYDKLLFEAFTHPLPMTFGVMPGGNSKDIYLTVSNSVRKQLSVAKEKSSILGSLADAQKEAEAQNKQPGKDQSKKVDRGNR